MADFRGGGYGMSPEAANAVKNINNGDTPYQRKRTLRNKAIMGGISAAGTLLSGAVKAHESEKQENAQKAALMKQAIANATKARDTEASGYARQYEQESRMADPEYRALMASQGLPTSGREFAQGQDPNEPPDYRSMAKAGLADIDAQANAGLAPVIGRDGQPVWATGEAFDEANTESEMHGRDINTAKRFMGGGLGGSTRMR